MSAKQARSKMSSLYIAWVFAEEKKDIASEIIALATESKLARRELESLVGGMWLQ